MAANGQEVFLTAFFREMRAQKLAYAVLHSWQDLPHEATSDVDMVIARRDMPSLPRVFDRVEAETGWRMVQRLWYDVPRCHYYVAVSPDTRASVALDFLSDPHGIGEYRIRDGLLLADCTETGLVRHLTPERELAYKLAKRRMKGIFKEKDWHFVKAYCPLCDPNKLNASLDAFAMQPFAGRVKQLLASMPPVEAWAKTMADSRPTFRLPGFNWTIHAHPCWWGYMVLRTLSRLRHPSGCVVYVKGKARAEDWDFGFTFRKVLVVTRERLTSSLRRRAYLKAWLVVVAEAGRNAIESVPGQIVAPQGGQQDLRQAVVDVLQRRYRRYFA